MTQLMMQIIRSCFQFASYYINVDLSHKIRNRVYNIVNSRKNTSRFAPYRESTDRHRRRWRRKRRSAGRREATRWPLPSRFRELGMHALEAPTMGPKPCLLLVGVASMVARIQTTGDITSCTCSRWKRGWESQRVGSTIFHVSNSRYYRWSRSYLEATLLFYTVDISPLRGKVAGWASQPGFTRSSPSLSLPFSRPASPSSSPLPSLPPLLFLTLFTTSLWVFVPG